ncbi:hypothetical protein MKZ38_010254 [Zalerion maritima]|uniref:Uncharacterized protein n=1 Tax=Zalerion maritima TaxID=339359 RepID=A0AAD5RSN2_9PEZI|nr:hypothetical protein MKZ38_010254 [Zalerion maritima]
MIGPDDQPVGIQGAQTISRARKSIPIPGLDELSLKHQKATGSGNTGPIISVSGRYLSLVYLLVAVLLAPPLGKAVVVVDVEGRFQVRRILKVASTKFPLGGPAGAVGDKQRSGGDGVEETANRDQPQMTNDTVSRISTEDLKHLYVYKPTREQLKPTLESAEGFMLYGNHGSKGREWWGTIVIGGGVGDGDISCGWRGWLRVEGERVEPFQEGISVQEALQLRKERHAQVDAARGRLLGRSEAGDVRLN